MSFKIKSKDYAKNNPHCRKVATITGGELDKKCLYLCDDDSAGETEIKLEGRSQFQPVPFHAKDQIERLFISGASGSGKSTYLAKWLRQFLKQKGNKEAPIYIFSSVDHDPVLDDDALISPNIVRVLDEVDEDEIISEPLGLNDFEEGSVIIFDDTLKIQNPKVRVMIFCLLESMLEIARHKNLTIITTSHILSNYRQTRTIQNEATAVTIFPAFAGGLYGIREYLKRKVGMSPQDIKKILSLSKTSRWITLYRTCPMFVLSAKQAYIYDQFTED
jgi:energy-coupling factor transporter ATP-binding protein EcfA2